MALPGILIALLLFALREPAREPSDRGRGRLPEALVHIRHHWRAYVTHSGASSCVVLLSQTFASWSPSLFVRFFHISAPQAGFTLGAVLLIGAPLGHIAGGTFMDRIVKRGVAAPAVPAMIVGLSGAMASILLLLTAHDLRAALICFGGASFFLSFGSPATLACVQMLAPAAMRGVVSALFLAVTTFIGIGAGPLLVGVATDLLGGPQYLNLALGAVLALFTCLGIALALASVRPFGKAMGGAT
jgi:MFS family permease